MALLVLNTCVLICWPMRQTTFCSCTNLRTYLTSNTTELCFPCVQHGDDSYTTSECFVRIKWNSVRETYNNIGLKCGSNNQLYRGLVWTGPYANHSMGIILSNDPNDPIEQALLSPVFIWNNLVVQLETSKDKIQSQTESTDSIITITLYSVHCMGWGAWR